MYVRLTKGSLLLAIAITTIGCSVPATRVGAPIAHNLPPAERLMHPGPGVGGPGPGVIPPMTPVGMPQAPAPDVQVFFNKPESMQIRWDVSGVGQYDSEPLVVPSRQNFGEGGLYQLKLTNIVGREGEELYPTLEIGPRTVRTAAYLEHSSIPIQFTVEDFDQVAAGNYVVKVIYVPDPEFQELALAGVDTLVSTRLDPGVDPIVEADRRGAILAIIRMGNRDKQMPGSSAAAATATQAGFAHPTPGGFSMADGPLPYNSSRAVPHYVSGVTSPPYGMTMTGTPIGLPGPPHIPLGIPAGLQRHEIRNHTAVRLPGPTPRVNVHVKQAPGLSYPRPANKVLIREQTMRPAHFNHQPPSNMVHGYPPGAGYGHGH